MNFIKKKVEGPEQKVEGLWGGVLGVSTPRMRCMRQKCKENVLKTKA